MSLHHKVAVILALIALALLAPFTLAWPTHDVALPGLPFTLSGHMLLGLITIGLAWAGTEAIVRSHPKVRPKQLRRPVLRCILPTAVTAASWLLLARLPNLESRSMDTAATAGALAVLISTEYHALDPAAPGRAALSILLQFATYAVAALLYGAIYLTSPDVSVPLASAVVSALLALRLLGEGELPLRRVVWVSAGIGLCLGVISSLLHPRMASAVTYSLTLLVFLYVLAGLARQFLWGKLRREVVLEYVLVGLAALALLFFYAR